jgi:hypothetical protein
MMKALFNHKIRRFLVLLVASGLLLLAVFLPALPASAAPVIILSPTSGAAGTLVTISGAVFESYEGDNINFFFDNTTIGEISPMIVPSGGSFNVTFSVPDNATPGAHFITAKSVVPADLVLAVGAFLVDAPTLKLDATQGPVGSVVNISGAGFNVYSSVTLYYKNTDSQKISTLAASPTGTFTTNFTIPSGPAGLHDINATSTRGNAASVSFQVLPDVKLSLNSAGIGDSLNVLGTGFAAASAVDIYFGSIKVTSGISDALGQFNIQFTVPDAETSTYVIKAQDGGGNIGNAVFSVAAGAKLGQLIGAVGGDLTIRGGGFQVGATVTIKFDADLISAAIADNNGDFTTTLTVPVCKGGKHSITISDGITTRVFPFTVETDAPPLPALRLPADNSFTRSTANFEWQAVTDVSVPVTYDLEVASDRSFAGTVVEKTGLTEARYTLAKNETLAPDSKTNAYFWRVRAVDGAGNASAWSAPWLMYISVPPVPSLRLPADATPVELPIRFGWQEVTSLSLPITYRLEISDELGFTPPLLEKTGLKTAEVLVTADDNIKLKKGTVYYWRVQAVDADKNASDWSATGSFRFMPKSVFPVWAIFTLIGIAALIAALLTYRLGRRSVLHLHDEPKA